MTPPRLLPLPWSCPSCDTTKTTSLAPTGWGDPSVEAPAPCQLCCHRAPCHSSTAPCWPCPPAKRETKSCHRNRETAKLAFGGVKLCFGSISGRTAWAEAAHKVLRGWGSSPSCKLRPKQGKEVAQLSPRQHKTKTASTPGWGLPGAAIPCSFVPVAQGACQMYAKGREGL